MNEQKNKERNDLENQQNTTENEAQFNGLEPAVKRKLSPQERKKRRRKRRFRKALLWVVFYAAAAVLIFCIVDIIFTVNQRKAARDRYAEMQVIYEINPAPEQSGEAEPLPTETPDPSKWYAPYAIAAGKRIDFAALMVRNPEVCGWISVDGTDIDYPILRASESDDYYLTHDIDGKVSEHGAICMDPRCEADFSDRVTMVYGHNMLDGSMFAPLYQYYNDPVFFSAGHRITVYMDNVMLCYRVVSAYEYGHEQPLYYYNMMKDADFLRYCETFLENRDMKAQIMNGVTITPDDRVLTLITSTNVRADKRLFVQAVLIHAE